MGVEVIPKVEETNIVRQEALTLSDQARSMEVTDQPSYDAAAEFLKSIKAMRKRVANFMDPLIGSIRDSLNKVLDKKKEVEAPLIQAELFLKDSLLAYAEIEKEKEREAQAKAEAEFAKREDERKLREAIEAEKAGAKPKAVERILTQPTTSPAPLVTPTLQQASGISVREVWSAEVTSLMQLVQAVAQGKVPILALTANTTFLNSQARSLKGTMNIPGVRAVCKKSMAAGTR
ncbi:hypothetical protein LCGC14_2509040 [marine sediment metagenome]|uniref:Uncharacterized protein n=1 Tax=marine sediment metagenome TaxID=412755 RepID=A0A0F9AZN6_9ZZZZ